jgi:hypothetical protein
MLRSETRRLVGISRSSRWIRVAVVVLQRGGANRDKWKYFVGRFYCLVVAWTHAERLAKELYE